MLPAYFPTETILRPLQNEPKVSPSWLAEGTDDSEFQGQSQHNSHNPYASFRTSHPCYRCNAKPSPLACVAKLANPTRECRDGLQLSVANAGEYLPLRA